MSRAPPQIPDDATAADVAEALHGAIVDASGHPDALTNDLLYLIGTVKEAVEGREAFEDDGEAARWAVASWCQEVGYCPDLTDYETGETVPLGVVPPVRPFDAVTPEAGR